MLQKKTTRNARRAENILYQSILDIAVELILEYAS
jgi:hypothetical protein